ncbi:MAG: DUF6295 family protein [Actinomycetota bacterium]|nr:DUF6295 family protein [Actinomycetota bacterium]
MCTYATVQTALEGSAEGPQSSWFHVTDGTVYFDHPVAMLSRMLAGIEPICPGRRLTPEPLHRVALRGR